MNFLVLNGSPKGKNSITLQTVLYLQKRHPEHTFTVLDVGQRIRQYEKDFTEARQAIDCAQVLLFVYPVYTFLVPYQLQRFIELMKEQGADTAGKFASQLSTSKHFYDVTAHKFIEANCYDMGLKYLPGLSADMDDLLTEKGQSEADSFFNELLFKVSRGIFSFQEPPRRRAEKAFYQRTLARWRKPAKRISCLSPAVPPMMPTCAI